jgi:hypothetical protein
VIIVEAEQLPQVKLALGDRAASYTESGPYGLRPGVYLTLLVQKEKAPEPQPVAPVIPPAAPAPESTAPVAPPAGTLNAAPTLTPSGPGLPVLPGMPMPLPGTQP